MLASGEASLIMLALNIATGEGMVEASIPKEVAMRLCDEIRAEKERKLFTQCWGCVKASKGDFSRMCASSRNDLRGCALVNRRFDEGQ